jgi:hypothetical protein
LEDSHAREITTLKMEIQQIMKGLFSIYINALDILIEGFYYFPFRKLQLFHAEGNFRTAGIGCQHHARSC